MEFLRGFPDLEAFTRRYALLRREGSVRMKRSAVPDFGAGRGKGAGRGEGAGNGGSAARGEGACGGGDDVPDFGAGRGEGADRPGAALEPLFAPGRAWPDVGERMERYRRAAVELASSVAVRSLRGAGLAPRQVTHLVTVSCTGLMAPGLECELAERLGLRDDAARHTVNFMGCYAMFHALRLADLICRGDAGAVVLVVSVELNTLHFQPRIRPDDLLGTYLFNDGAAACVVETLAGGGAGRWAARGEGLGAPPVPPMDGSSAGTAGLAVGDAAGFALRRFRSKLVPEGKEEMRWDVGPNGFDLRLSARVPKVLEAGVAPVVEALLADGGVEGLAEVVHLAVHPGGKAVLQSFCRALGLDERVVEGSMHVLREYGNMSSATILFVLQDLLERHPGRPGPVVAAAFGPGLTIETALMDMVCVPVDVAESQSASARSASV